MPSVVKITSLLAASLGEIAEGELFPAMASANSTLSGVLASSAAAFAVVHKC